MQLVVEELRNELNQDFVLTSQKNYEIYAIKIYLFANNASSIVGNFRLGIYDGLQEVAFKTFDISDIVSQSNIQEEYFHSWYPIFFDNPVILQKGSYNFKLTSTGYSYASNSFIGWIREHENLKVPITYEPKNSLQNPLSYEVYTRQGFGVVRLVDIDDSYQSATPPDISGIGFVVYAPETISDGGFVSYDTDNSFQYRPVIGDSGPVDLSPTPFGTVGDFLDGQIIRLRGSSDTDTVTVVFGNVQYGAIVNGNRTLGLDVVLELQYDAEQERWIEISFNQ